MALARVISARDIPHWNSGALSGYCTSALLLGWLCANVMPSTRYLALERCKSSNYLQRWIGSLQAVSPTM